MSTQRIDIYGKGGELISSTAEPVEDDQPAEPSPAEQRLAALEAALIEAKVITTTDIDAKAETAEP